MGDGFPLGAGRYHFLVPDPSKPRCPASPRPAASSAPSSPLRATAATAPQIHLGRRISTSTCRMSQSSLIPWRRQTSAVAIPASCLIQDRDDLLFVEPASLHSSPTPWRRTLPAIGHISGEHVCIDFPDSLCHYSEEEAGDYYGGTIDILAEIGWCLLFHAAWPLLSAGGRDIFSAKVENVGSWRSDSMFDRLLRGTTNTKLFILFHMNRHHLF